MPPLTKKPITTQQPSISQPDKRLFFLLNMARHHLFAYAEAQCLENIGITVTQAGAMLFIAKHAGCQQKALATALGLKKSAVTGLLNRMQQQQLIERHSCPNDARASNLFLSTIGKAKLPLIQPLIQQLNTQFLSEFSEQEITVIVRFLNTVIHTCQ